MKRFSRIKYFKRLSIWTSKAQAYIQKAQSNMWDAAFCKIVNGWKPLTIFAKSFILDVRLGSKYLYEAPVLNKKSVVKRKTTGLHHCS